MSNLAEQLRQISELHASGSLNDAEFGAAKARLLGESTPPQNTLTALLALQNEVASLDRQWQIEREKYKVNGRYNSSIPKPGDGAKSGVGIVIFGGIWTAVATFIAIGATSAGAPAIFWVLPAFGVFVIFAGLSQSGEITRKADDYKQAEAVYKAKRAQLDARIRALETK